MTNIFNLGGGDFNEDEIALEVPDEAEATDLRRHAMRCAYRYKIMRRGQQAQDKRLTRIELFLAAIFLLALASKVGVVDGLKGFFGF